MGKIMNSVSIWGLFFCPLLCKKILLNDIFLLNQSFLKNCYYICNEDSVANGYRFLARMRNE